MKDASKRGYSLWNWGGTWATQESVYRFKKRWGAWERKYTYYIQINDQKLYRAKRQELLRNYEGFFVIPFNLLIGELIHE
jgi:lipid II:glycine glycyltransferase (peptidoglycan interpeptide bridge formation enzyme)